MSSQDLPSVESPKLADYARSLRTASLGWPPAGTTRTRMLLIASKFDAMAAQKPEANLMDLRLDPVDAAATLLERWQQFAGQLRRVNHYDSATLDGLLTDTEKHLVP